MVSHGFKIKLTSLAPPAADPPPLPSFRPSALAPLTSCSLSEHPLGLEDRGPPLAP